MIVVGKDEVRHLLTNIVQRADQERLRQICF